MRTLRRNTRTFWYALYLRREPVRDAQGRETLEQRMVYTDPVPARGNISPAQTRQSVQIFGGTGGFDRTIIPERADLPVDTYSVLWIDRAPYDERGNAAPYDYVVTKVARSLNGALLAVRRVEVS